MKEVYKGTAQHSYIVEDVETYKYECTCKVVRDKSDYLDIFYIELRNKAYVKNSNGDWEETQGDYYGGPGMEVSQMECKVFFDRSLEDIEKWLKGYCGENFEWIEPLTLVI